jgi:deoxycytidylate deaminase
MRVVRANCLSGGECAVTCRGDEILATAYCGPTRNQPNFIGERQASCGVEANTANAPLVAICVQAPP